MTREEAKGNLMYAVKWNDMPEKEALKKAIKALDNYDVLDKIRAEIEQITDTMGVSYNQYLSKIDVLQIIDKYKAKVEPQERSDKEWQT